MITKFEAIGISVSIGLMAVALFFLQHSGTTEDIANTRDQAAAVVVVDETNSDATGALQNALIGSFDANGLSKLVVDDVAVGTGKEAQAGDTVSVHYVGRLENGQEFDNSYARGEVFTFTLGEGKVIAGWEEGILGMKEGGKRVLVIPPQLAYGDKNIGPIPAGSTLLFSVELVTVE